MDMPSAPAQLLGYVFWHWPASAAAVARYEADLLRFHASLASRPPEGFLRSSAFAVSGASWLPGRRDGYEDWYLVRGWAALGGLNRDAVAPAHAATHDEIADQADGGTAGLYALRAGRDAPRQTGAAWFAKPRDWSYDKLFAAVGDCLDGGTALWQRQLTLGPAPEFCLRGTTTPALPPALSDQRVTHRHLT
jgi:hypothetical protein